MAKPSPTQRKILETAAGIKEHRPYGRSQHGGWSGAYVVCRRNGWTDNRGEITSAGLLALGVATTIVLTVADHDQNGFVHLAETTVLNRQRAMSLISSIDAIISDEEEPGAEASFWFILDLRDQNGDCEETSKRMLPLQLAMSIAPDAVSQWLEERPDPDKVMRRRPLALDIDRIEQHNQPPNVGK